MAKEISDDTDVAAEVEAISKMYAPVPVLFVVGLERSKYPEFDFAGISVLLDGPDDLDGDTLATFAVPGLNNLAERSLAKESNYLVWYYQSAIVYTRRRSLATKLTSVGEICVWDDDIMAVVIINLEMLVVRVLGKPS